MSAMVDEESLIKYTGNRQAVNELIEGPIVKAIMGTTIMINAVQVLYESDIGSMCRFGNNQGACDQEKGWLLITNWIYLGLYSIEMAARIFVHRLRCFCDPWDMFDGIIIIIGVMSEFVGSSLPSPGILRLARLARLAKAMRFVPLPKEVRVMINGFVSALFAIGFGCCLVFVMLALWGVVFVALINEYNHEPEILVYYEKIDCEWAPKAWDSIAHSVFTFTQLLIMGESWDCNAIPLIERHPWILLLFMSCFFTVILGMTNLILAVIVDKALQAHDANIAAAAKAKIKQEELAIHEFNHLCRGLDTDGSGSLSLEEMLEGFDNVAEFRNILELLDIGRDDLKFLFHMMDQDRSGECDYDEFGRELVKIKNENIQTILSFMKHHVVETQVVVNSIYKSVSGKSSKDIFRSSKLDTNDVELPTEDELQPTPQCTPGAPAAVPDLRTAMEGRALEICRILEEQTQALAQEELGKLSIAVASLQTKLPQLAIVPGPCSSASDGGKLQDTSYKLTIAETKLTTFDPEVINGGPLMQELKRVETSLEDKFSRMLSEFQNAMTPMMDPVARGGGPGCRYTCLPQLDSGRVSALAAKPGGPQFQRA